MSVYKKNIFKQLLIALFFEQMLIKTFIIQTTVFEQLPLSHKILCCETFKYACGGVAIKLLFVLFYPRIKAF